MSGCYKQNMENLSRADCCQNLMFYGNGENMWNANGKVSRIVEVKILKSKILWYMAVAAANA